MAAMILTRRGWLDYDAIRAGDETIGYNPAIGASEWTPITNVHHYDSAPVWCIGNVKWHARVPPNQRWWSERAIDRRDDLGTTCPECGTEWATPKGMVTHRGRAHGARANKRTNYVGQFVETRNLLNRDRIRTAAVADTEGIIGISLDEVRIIAWLQGDGHIRPVLGKPTVCPACGWLPRRRKPSRGGLVRQAANSVAVHRAKAHGVHKTETAGAQNGDYDGSIFQAKPAMVVKLRALLADVPHSEHSRQRQPHHLPSVDFKLRRSYVTDLMKRSRVIEMGPEAFVLRLSPDQRRAWLGAMIDAEGHRQAGTKPGNSEFVRIAQVNGPLQEAIRLAIYLEGYRPSFSSSSAERNGFQPSGAVGMCNPIVSPAMFQEPKVLDNEPVWCVTTKLGTWTKRQDGLVMLTGNYGSAPVKIKST
jgi:hypothetical protein